MLNRSDQNGVRTVTSDPHGSLDGQTPRQLFAAVPYGSSDPSVRARVLGWAEEPVEVVMGGISPRRVVNTIRRVRHHHGPRLLLRNLSPIGQGYPEQAFLRVNSRNEPAIYELDDGLPFDDGRLAELGRWWKPLVAKARIAERAAQAATRVIAGNEALANWALRYCNDVVIVPTCVDPTHYDVRSSWELDGPPVIGWIGSAATAIHLASITDALANVHRSIGARLVVVSSSAHDIPDRLRPFTTLVNWRIGIEHTITASFDVGVMPLPDRPYERAKCAFKLLHYGAAGVPMIGSPVGASAELLRRAGAVAPSHRHEWTDALTEVLTASADRRQALAERGRATIETHYAFDAWRTRWRAAVGLDLEVVAAPAPVT